jgi:hypothetical protein
MKAFAQLSPTAPAVFVAAMGISLWVFLLPGAGVQGGPTPLLAVIGGAAGRVAADLPATANERASEPVGKAASSAQLATARSAHFVPRRKAATKEHRIHRSARSGVGRRAPSAPPQAAAPAASTTPITTRQSFSSPTTATSKARGHGRARTTPGAPMPGAHAHGKALGRSGERDHGLPHGHAKKAPAAPLSATTPPQVNGGGNGDKGGKK